MSTQTEIAKKIRKSQSHLSRLIAGKRRPSWATAKQLAKETNTTPELWLDGSPEEIREALKNKAA